MTAFAITVLLVERGLLHCAARREVSTALLASGGTLPIRDLSLAAAAMLLRFFARIVLPGLVLQTLVFAIWDWRRDSRTARA